MKYFLHKLGLTEHEFVRVKIAWILRCLYQLGWVVAWTIVTALFVESFGIKSLVFLFLAEACLWGLSSLFASFVCQKCPLSRYIYGLIAGVILSLGIAWGIGLEHKELFFLFVLIAKSFFFTQLSIALYRQNEELFSPAEAIRLMPIVESSVTIGGVVGALFTVIGLSFLTTKEVLILWVFGLIGIVWIIRSLPQMLHVLPQWHKMAESPVKKPWISEVNSSLKQLPFVRYMMVGIFIHAALFAFLDVELTRKVQKEVQEHAHHAYHEYQQHDFSPDMLQGSVFNTAKDVANDVANSTKEAIDSVSTKMIMNETLAHNLGMLHLVFALVSVVFQFLITPKVLSKLGVVGTWMSFNIALLLAFVGFVFGQFSIKTSNIIWHGTHSLGESSYHVSFYSLSRERREAIRLFLDGIVRPLGIAFMVALFLVFDPQVIAMGGMVALVGLLLLSAPMKKAFTNISKQNIREKANVEQKMHAIEVLAQKGHVASGQILVEELKDMAANDLIRQKIISTLTRIQDPEVLSTYIEMLNAEDEPDEIKIQVLDSLLKLDSLKGYLGDHAFGQHHLLQTLKGLFHETDHSHLKKLVVMNIFQHMPTEEVVPFFLNTIAHADESLQSIYLRSSKVFNDPGIRPYLKPYLESDSSRIKGHAVIALWDFEDRSLLRDVLHDLSQKDTAEDLIAALYAVGEVKDNRSKVLVQKFVDHDDEVVRLHAHIALAKLGDDSCVDMIVESIVSGSPRLTQMSLGMVDRVDDVMRDQILKEMKSRVSSRVLLILHPQNVQSVDDLQCLHKSVLHELKRLYKLVGQFDDLLAIEKLG